MMNPQILFDLRRFYPEIALTASLLAVVVVDLIVPASRRAVCFWVAALGLITALVFSGLLFGAEPGTLFYNMVVLDQMAVFFKVFLILTSLLVLIAAPASMELSKSHLGEFYALLLSVTLAMLLLSSSVDLLMLFLSLEMVSLTSYVMVGYLRYDRQSNEASLKYILFGAVSTGSMLYGITLLFGMTGSTKFSVIRGLLSSGDMSGINAVTLLIAAALLLAGFGFKTAAVPFHFWCPDVYTGAPTPVTAFLSVAPKAAGFAVMVRFFFTGLSLTSTAVWSPLGTLNWPFLVVILSILTMTLGNIAALRQDNLKRMLAYSSIAHAGYILMGVVVVTPAGLQAILIYLITYLFMNLGAFFVVIEVANGTGSFDLKDYRGLYRRSPFLTIAMTVFMLSLMGIPPFAGFFGKFFLFGAAVNRNLAWFAVIGALNSVIAVYYYARVIKSMIIEENEDSSAIPVSWTGHLLIWAMLIPTSALLVVWNRVQALTASSIRFFAGS
jgi:NADH-quinone oxidoreductase subunit N